VTTGRFLLLGAGDLAREVAKILVGTAAESDAPCDIAAFSKGPGACASDFTKTCASSAEALRDFPPSVPLGQMQTVDEVASLAAWLISAASGATVLHSGGWKNSGEPPRRKCDLGQCRWQEAILPTPRPSPIRRLSAAWRGAYAPDS